MPYNTIEYIHTTGEWLLQQRKVTLRKARDFVQFRLKGADLQSILDVNGYDVETYDIRQDSKVVEEHYKGVSEDFDVPNITLFKIIYEKEKQKTSSS